MNHAHTDRTAHLVGGGGSAQQGYAMRGKVGIGFGVACAGLS